MRIVLTALLMLATAPAWAEWVKVDETDEVLIYVDPATIRKDGNLRRIWEMQDLKARDSDGSLSRRALSEYDCKGKRLRLLSLSTHSGQMATGKIIITVSPSGKWDCAVPGTSGQTMLKFVCAR